MPLSPLQFLAILIAITALARLVYIVGRQRQRRAIHALARQWQMHFSAHDRFALSDRVAERFPVPGAAELRVIDLIYGREGANAYRYLFTAEYTVGVTHGKHRHRRAVTFRETRPSEPAPKPGEQRSGEHRGGEWSPFVLGEPEQDIVEQYIELADQIEEEAATDAVAPAPAPVTIPTAP